MMQLEWEIRKMNVKDKKDMSQDVYSGTCYIHVEGEMINSLERLTWRL